MSGLAAGRFDRASSGGSGRISWTDACAPGRTRGQRHRRRSAHWLDDLGAVSHPAVMTRALRRRIEAVVNGVTVYALEICGLAPHDQRTF